MGNRTERLSDVQKQAIAWIHQSKAKEMGAIGIEIGKMLAELTAELADRQMEAGHWRACFEAARDELKVVASVAMQHMHTERLVVTKADLQGLPPNVTLNVLKPEPGVRIYHFKRQEEDGPTRQ